MLDGPLRPLDPDAMDVVNTFTAHRDVVPQLVSVVLAVDEEEDLRDLSGLLRSAGAPASVLELAGS